MAFYRDMSFRTPAARPDIAAIGGRSSVRDPHTQIAAGLEQLVILTRVTFRYRTVALRDRGRCQPTVVSLTNDRSALRHVLACLGLGFPAKSVPEQANRDCTSPVTESC